MNRSHVDECKRLYQMLGDRSLTPQQIEAARVSMNVHFCAGVVP
jgi:ribosomal protein L16/L10AE